MRKRRVSQPGKSGRSACSSSVREMPDALPAARGLPGAATPVAAAGLAGGRGAAHAVSSGSNQIARERVEDGLGWSLARTRDARGPLASRRRLERGSRLMTTTVVANVLLSTTVVVVARVPKLRRALTGIQRERARRSLRSVGELAGQSSAKKAHSRSAQPGKCSCAKSG